MAIFDGYIKTTSHLNNVCNCYCEAPGKLAGNFQAYVPLLLQVEGGYQNHPNDPGNFNSLGQNVGTNKGISARFYEQIIKRPPTVADMKAITTAMATQMYHDHFWKPLRGDEIKSQAIANTVVDHHVNSGRGVRLAQEVLNKNFGKKLKVDNSMGPLTLAAINSVNEGNFVTKYNQARADFYASLNNSPSFLAGWLKRLESFAAENRGKILGFNTIVAVALFFFLIYKLENDEGSTNKNKLQRA